MRKGLLLFIAVVTLSSLLNAQTISRVKSSGYLDSPPVPVNTFTNAAGAFQILSKYPVSELVKVNPD